MATSSRPLLLLLISDTASHGETMKQQQPKQDLPGELIMKTCTLQMQLSCTLASRPPTSSPAKPAAPPLVHLPAPQLLLYRFMPPVTSEHMRGPPVWRRTAASRLLRRMPMRSSKPPRDLEPQP